MHVCARLGGECVVTCALVYVVCPLGERGLSVGAHKNRQEIENWKNPFIIYLGYTTLLGTLLVGGAEEVQPGTILPLFV